MIYPNNFEQKIGFDKIRDLLKDFCLSELGKQKVDELVFSSKLANVITELSETDEFKQICLLEQSFPVSNYIDVKLFLKKIRVEGLYLEENELFDLKRSLEAIWAIIRFFNLKGESEYPYLKKLAGDVIVHKYVIDRANLIINKFGKIKDNASKELSDIRSDLQSKQMSVSKKLTTILKQAQSEGWADSNLSLTIVNGRTVLPIESTYKRKIKGFVHDESATGKTSYIEPAEVVDLNNEIKELEYAERREIIKILLDFSCDILPYLDDLLIAYDFLAQIDFIRSKALLSIKISAIKPGINHNTVMNWVDARHPLLYLSHIKDGKIVVPLTVSLNEKNRILLISGPNAGGKSVCLKTVGLLQYMLQCGLLIPVAGATEVCLFENLFIDIGDEQSIENDLSTYSSHLLNMKYFLKNSNEQTLILIDEFGTGTEPMLGGAIAESILLKLNENKAYGIITTHYTNLKHLASSTEGILNAAMMFDNQKMQPLYILSMGKPGSSFAFEIARKIGLPEDIIESASEKVGKDHINFDKHLREALRDKRYWEEKRYKIRKEEKHLEELLAKYTEELEKSEKLRKTIVQQAKQEAEQLLLQTNKMIENTISQIKDANAEKEKTKEIRKGLDDFKKNYAKEIDQKEVVKKEKIQELKNTEESLLKSYSIERKEPVKTDKIKLEKDDKIRVGDKVRIKDQDAVGEVLDSGDSSLVVAFGNMITTIKEDKLERISNNEYRQLTRNQGISTPNFGYNVSKRKLEFKPSIDVRGKRADEALQLVSELIDEAIMVDVNEVKILHGKGNGILRQLIRDFLATVDLIKSYSDEHVEFGGAGITVVKFR